MNPTTWSQAHKGWVPVRFSEGAGTDIIRSGHATAGGCDVEWQMPFERTDPGVRDDPGWALSRTPTVSEANEALIAEIVLL